MKSLKNAILSIPSGQPFYTSLRYRDDKKRRLIHELKRLGYFKQTGRFSFIRTDKKNNEDFLP